MRLSAPKKITFWVAVIIAIIGVVGFFVAAIAPYAVWILLVAFVLLALGNLLKGF